MYLDNFRWPEGSRYQGGTQVKYRHGFTDAGLVAILATQERKTADTNPVGAFGVAAYRRTETWAGFWNVDEAECDLTKVTI